MLVSALSYIATVSSIVLRGAAPVFCDVDPETLNIAPASVEAKAEGTLTGDREELSRFGEGESELWDRINARDYGYRIFSRLVCRVRKSIT